MENIIYQACGARDTDTNDTCRHCGKELKGGTVQMHAAPPTAGLDQRRTQAIPRPDDCKNMVFKPEPDPGMALKIDDPKLSGEHAVLLYCKSRFIFEDRLSSNGSYLNGEKVIGQKEVFHGGRLDLGDHSFILTGVPTNAI